MPPDPAQAVMNLLAEMETARTEDARSTWDVIDWIDQLQAIAQQLEDASAPSPLAETLRSLDRFSLRAEGLALDSFGGWLRRDDVMSAVLGAGVRAVSSTPEPEKG